LSDGFDSWLLARHSVVHCKLWLVLVLPVGAPPLQRGSQGRLLRFVLAGQNKTAQLSTALGEVVVHR